MSGAEARRLKGLYWLVAALTAVMIVGVVAIAAALVIRLSAAPPLPPLPAELSLPEDVRPVAVTAGPGWYAVATEDARLLIYGADGTFRREVPLGE